MTKMIELPPHLAMPHAVVAGTPEAISEIAARLSELAIVLDIARDMAIEPPSHVNVCDTVGALVSASLALLGTIDPALQHVSDTVRELHEAAPAHARQKARESALRRLEALGA